MGMGEKEHEGGGSGGSGGRSKDHARHGLPPPNRDALNGMGEFVLAQVAFSSPIDTSQSDKIFCRVGRGVHASRLVQQRRGLMLLAS